MRLTLVLTIPMAVLWMIFAQQFTIEGFIVGVIFGFAILLVIRSNTSFDEGDGDVNLARIPSQVIALVIYIVGLTIDVVLSGVDVAGKVLQPTMPIKPGTQTISTQDPTNTSLVSALSGHSITITPGEMVVDYGKDEHGNITMLVHTLDQNSSTREKLERDQTKRLRLILRILGKDVPQEGASNGMD
ncbi:MAG: Na+/H+ antiporter subunit E [Anaerolineae bacterium]